MDRSKEIASKASGILAFAAPTYFAWTVFQQAIPQNVATWGLTLLLDALGLFLAVKAGNRKPWLQLGWFLAAFCILAAVLLGNSPWHWGVVESVSVVFCLIAIVLWLTLSPQAAIFAFITAFIIASIPLMVDYWRVPQPSTTWLWVVTVFTCALSIYGAEKKDVAHTAIPAGAILQNAFFVFLCVR